MNLARDKEYISMYILFFVGIYLRNGYEGKLSEKENALAFNVKRKCVLSKTLWRLKCTENSCQFED